MHADAAYLAPQGFAAELEEELLRSGRDIVFRRGRLLGASGPALEAVWAENIWYEPALLPIRSIADGASILKSLQRNWALFSTVEHRRAALIQAALPKVSARPLRFGDPAPAAPLGSWTLWDRDRILASARCRSLFPHGAVHFEEDKDGPPNRAYLKLWEAFTRLGAFPRPGELCLDLGSSPGGWSWVLAHLGARVFSVDKAPLAPHIAGHPLVEYCRGSAFAVEPQLVGNADWLLCDVACYPERLLGMVRTWIQQSGCVNMICTIKFAGKTDFAVLEDFLRIPDSSARHLFVNKHEVTWVRLAGKTPFW